MVHLSSTQGLDWFEPYSFLQPFNHMFLGQLLLIHVLCMPHKHRSCAVTHPKNCQLGGCFISQNCDLLFQSVSQIICPLSPSKLCAQKHVVTHVALWLLSTLLTSEKKEYPAAPTTIHQNLFFFLILTMFFSFSLIFIISLLCTFHVFYLRCFHSLFVGKM